MMKHLILLLVFSGCFFRGATQTSSVKILDISIRSISQTDTFSFAPPVHVDSSLLLISFKVNNAAASSKAHIYIGTVQDSFDIRKIEALFTQAGTSYYLSFNGENNKIVKYHTKLTVKLSNIEKQQWQCITLFVEDKNGLRSNFLYFRKNN